MNPALSILSTPKRSLTKISVMALTSSASSGANTNLHSSWFAAMRSSRMPYRLLRPTTFVSPSRIGMGFSPFPSTGLRWYCALRSCPRSSPDSGLAPAGSSCALAIVVPTHFDGVIVSKSHRL